uniref:Uncharacterized protein n=1 Tax=Rhipicephalus appendiculatus TaxID=34631 RepID=A0A131YC27_RHIAP
MRVGIGGGVSGCLPPLIFEMLDGRFHFSWHQAAKRRPSRRDSKAAAMVLSLPDCTHPPPFTTLRSINCMSDLTFFFLFFFLL